MEQLYYDTIELSEDEYIITSDNDMCKDYEVYYKGKKKKNAIGIIFKKWNGDEEWNVEDVERFMNLMKNIER